MKRRILIWLAALLLLAGAAMAEGGITSVGQLNQPGMTVGVGTGSISEVTVKHELPNARIAYYDDKFMAYEAVAQGKIDAFVYDLRQMQLSIQNGQSGVRLLDETMDETVRIAVGISQVSKIPELEAKLNQFIAELRADGTLDDMFDRWVVRADDTMPEIALPEKPQYHLTVGTSGTVPPYSYYVGSTLNGYDIELARRFAAWLGADLTLKVYDYGAIVPAAQSGKIDCIMANLQISPERRDNFLFSDTLFEEKQGVMVRDDGQGAAASNSAPTSLDQLENGRIGIQTGTNYADLVMERLPGATISYFNNYTDMAAAVEALKIDGFPGDEPVLRLMAAEDDQLAILDEALEGIDMGFVLPKSAAGEKLMGELNAWIADMNASGAMEALIAKWVDGPDSEKTMPDYASLPAPNGKLTFATEAAYAPMNYYRDGEIVGLEVEMAALFCEAYGYGMDAVAMNFDGIIPAVQSGKADFAAAAIAITEERRESVNFSDPYYHCGTVMAVLKAARDAATSAGAPITGFSDLEHARIGATTGSVQVLQVEERFPDAEIFYFTTTVDMLNALRAHNIDAFAESEPILRYVMAENPDLTCLDERLGEGMQVGAIFPKTDAGEALRDEFSAFIREIRENGVYDEIQEIWFGADEDKRVVPDLDDLPATNGTLRMATDTTFVPFVYIKDGNPVGLDVDTAVRFCKAYGYGLEVVAMDFSGIIPSVTTGKVDFACSGIAYTAERAESVLYSEPTYEGGSVIAVLKAEEPAAAAAGAEDDSFWSGLRSSFEKTFHREDRWQLFAQGVLTTLLITALTILFGTALGFGVFMLCRNGNPVANAVTRFCLWLVQGMPMVVLLMILYYIIFGSVAINGVAVAVIGFTLTFGASVFGLLKMGVGAVDRGQYEAAYALGHSNRHTFFTIILPQAIPHVLSAYKGEIVGLIKATAIVGYIAVQDLTKMGDIVRSRTYEAFFPLIAVTIIYFALEGLLGFLVSRISVNMLPKKRSRARILKGIRTHDGGRRA